MLLLLIEYDAFEGKIKQNERFTPPNTHTNNQQLDVFLVVNIGSSTLIFRLSCFLNYYYSETNRSIVYKI